MNTHKLTTSQFLLITIMDILLGLSGIFGFFLILFLTPFHWAINILLGLLFVVGLFFVRTYLVDLFDNHSEKSSTTVTMRFNRVCRNLWAIILTIFEDSLAIVVFVAYLIITGVSFIYLSAAWASIVAGLGLILVFVISYYISGAIHNFTSDRK